MGSGSISPGSQTRSALLATLSTKEFTSSLRWTLVTVILQDPGCRLAACHVEQLLRCRLPLHSPSTPLYEDMQPTMLRMALQQEAASAGQLLSWESPVTQDTLFQWLDTPAWMDTMLQLDLLALEDELRNMQSSLLCEQVPRELHAAAEPAAVCHTGDAPPLLFASPPLSPSALLRVQLPFPNAPSPDTSGCILDVPYYGDSCLSSDAPCDLPTPDSSNISPQQEDPTVVPGTQLLPPLTYPAQGIKHPWSESSCSYLRPPISSAAALSPHQVAYTEDLAAASGAVLARVSALNLTQMSEYHDRVAAMEAARACLEHTPLPHTVSVPKYLPEVPLSNSAPSAARAQSQGRETAAHWLSTPTQTNLNSSPRRPSIVDGVLGRTSLTSGIGAPAHPWAGMTSDAGRPPYGSVGPTALSSGFSGSPGAGGTLLNRSSTPLLSALQAMDKFARPLSGLGGEGDAARWGHAIAMGALGTSGGWPPAMSARTNSIYTESDGGMQQMSGPPSLRRSSLLGLPQLGLIRSSPTESPCSGFLGSQGPEEQMAAPPGSNTDLEAVVKALLSDQVDGNSTATGRYDMLSQMQILQAIAAVQGQTSSNVAGVNSGPLYLVRGDHAPDNMAAGSMPGHVYSPDLTLGRTRSLPCSQVAPGLAGLYLNPYEAGQVGSYYEGSDCYSGMARTSDPVGGLFPDQQAAPWMHNNPGSVGSSMSQQPSWPGMHTQTSWGQLPLGTQQNSWGQLPLGTQQNSWGQLPLPIGQEMGADMGQFRMSMSNNDNMAAARPQAQHHSGPIHQVRALSGGMPRVRSQLGMGNHLPTPYGFPGPVGAEAGLQALNMGMHSMALRPSTRVRAELALLVSGVPGLKMEDLDLSILCTLLSSKSDEEAVMALRGLANNMGHLTFLAQLLKPAHMQLGNMDPGMGMSKGPAAAGNKAMLQKLPLRVAHRLEELVARCPALDLRHFDAGVIKVMVQLCEMSEAEVMDELHVLENTDLSNVEYMPAYLNKRLNNRLWSKRKAHQHAMKHMGPPSVNPAWPYH